MIQTHFELFEPFESFKWSQIVWMMQHSNCFMLLGVGKILRYIRVSSRFNCSLSVIKVIQLAVTARLVQSEKRSGTMWNAGKWIVSDLNSLMAPVFVWLCFREFFSGNGKRCTWAYNAPWEIRVFHQMHKVLFYGSEFEPVHQPVWSSNFESVRTRGEVRVWIKSSGLRASATFKVVSSTYEATLNFYN